MVKNSENSNGAGLLALAMKRVFKEAVEDGVTPLVELVSGIEKNMATKEYLDERLANTDQNVQRQLAEHRKGVASDFKKELSKS